MTKLIEKYFFKPFQQRFKNCFIQVIGKIIKQCHAAKKPKSYPYRISEIRYKIKSYVLIIQVSGKNIFFEKSPHEVFKNEILMKGFSPSDIWTISFMLYEEQSRPQYKMISRHFSLVERCEIFIFQNEKMEGLVSVSALDLLHDSSFIGKISQIDAYKIGYSVAEMLVMHEKD